jgi:3-deoxy-D-manno-octulosonic acid kinase
VIVRPPAVPGGYVVHRIADTVLVLDRAESESLVRLRLADPAVRRTLFARAMPRGRGRTPSVPIRAERFAVLRRYRHGGLFAGVTHGLLLGPGRALRELRVTVRAEASGAPVPHVLCLVLWPVLGPFWSALIGTREERPAVDLLARLVAEPGPRERERLACEVGRAVRRLHDAGVAHRDLQVRNIVVTQDPSRRIVLVDLDRAAFHRHGLVPTRRRASNLGRLVRSLLKTGAWPRLTRRDHAAFLRGYLAGNRRLRGELRAWLPWERLKLAWHRLTYHARGWPAPTLPSYTEPNRPAS